MPKKFKGINSKSYEALERKKNRKKEIREQNERDAEDAKWIEIEPKDLSKKKNKMLEIQQKKDEMIKRKMEKKQLEEQEQLELEKLGKKKGKEKHITRAELLEINELKKLSEEKKSNDKLLHEKPMVENINRNIPTDLSNDSIVFEAKNVENAIDVLQLAAGSSIPIDRHPERRMKAAFLTFCDERLPELKEDYPNLKLSQYKQMLKKEWSKHPDNPIIVQNEKRNLQKYLNSLDD